MVIVTNLETGKDGDVPQVPRFARRSATLHVIVGGAFNRLQATGAGVSGLAAFGHAGVKPWCMPPHLCGLIRPSIKPVSWNRTGYPPFIGLGFALVRAIAIGGFIAARVLPNTACIVRSMWVDSFIRRAVTRGDSMFCGRKWLIAAAVACVVPVMKRVGEIGAMCGRVTLRGVVDCVFLGLVVGTGWGVSRAERER